MINLKWDPGCKPVYKTSGAAGADVVSRSQTICAPGKISFIPTGVYIDTYTFKGQMRPELQLRLRSSLAAKEGLIIPNGVGTIDCDYKDEIKLMVYNTNSYGVVIKSGQRVGQLILNYVYYITNAAKEINTRGGGFGSTGMGV